MAAAAPVRLADYTAWAFQLPTIQLNVNVQDTFVLVEARMELVPQASAAPLALRGVELGCFALRWTAANWNLPSSARPMARLTIDHPPAQPFVLETCCRIDPYTNSSLEGLYASGGMLSTQCEAEGFRRITFHPDRPDVLSRWTVRIEASRASCPVLLSNGNAIAEDDLADGRHAVTWEDPFPKPSYLFATGGRRIARNSRFVHHDIRSRRDAATACGGGG